ncbi:MAG TPA: ArsA-related P-loop ATPase [Solirubrobacteraceae bacterium]|jgi:anion-transporting  ArsA/GET3 family ATPase|nr:ArsA-related P-loop ATPase [Solirubrobacteraceae bacterium]
MAAGKRRNGQLPARLAGKRVIVTLGAGGVGKTTTSAALALGLAMRGAKAAVVTIDPARRLASSLGLDELSGEPHRIDDEALRGAGVTVKGELWAMMLDAKATFDSVVSNLAADNDAREEILANPVYGELSTAVAGSQELSAVAKLYELYEDHDFDVIVLDTPPSRNALDFLDAPGRLLGFLEGRALQVFIAPGGLTARLFGRGTALVFSIFARVTGVDMFSELSRFFRSMGGVLDGFGERTRAVQELLRSKEVMFLIVTSPEPEPVREARFLAARLAETRRPAPQLIVNRVHLEGLGGRSEGQLTEQMAPALGAELARRVAANLADIDVLVRRDREAVSELSDLLDGGPPVLVGHLDEEVQDLLGLTRIAEQLGL